MSGRLGHQARLIFSLPFDILTAVHGALAPETQGAGGAGETPKTRTTVAIEGDALVLSVDADDIASLRAAVNSHVRWIDAASRAALLAK